MPPVQPDHQQPAEPPVRVAKGLLALVALLTASLLLWPAHSAMSEHYEVWPDGCWPNSLALDSDNRRVNPADFLEGVMGDLKMNPVSRFFLGQMRHKLLFFLLLFCSTVGWSASLLLRLLPSANQAPARSPVSVPTWLQMLSSLALSATAGGILFLLVFAGSLTLSPNDEVCLPEVRAYVALLGGLASGLSIERFFSWFKRHAHILWERSTGPLSRLGGP